MLVYSLSNTNEIDKDSIYFSTLKIEKYGSALKVSGKVKGFYCEKGRLEIIIEGEHSKRMIVPIKNKKFTGSNWIEGTVRKMTDFDRPKIVDFNISCFDKE
jgi:hypothetical protein